MSHQSSGLSFLVTLAVTVASRRHRGPTLFGLTAVRRMASRPTMMAPPRANAPPRALFWNAKFSPNGTRESVPAGSVKCPRSKTWDAQRSAAETQTLQELRDRWDTLDVDGTCHPCHMRVTWCVEPTAANPHDARPARGSATPLIGVCVKHKEPFRFFRKHSFAFLVLQPVAAFGKVALTPRTERYIPWKGIKIFAVDKKLVATMCFSLFAYPNNPPSHAS
jgi:hypothetical protein